MNKKTLFLPLIAAVVLTGCGTDDPDKELLNDTFDGYFSYNVKGDTAEDEGYILPVGNIAVSFDDDNKKADITIKGFSYGDPQHFNTTDLVLTGLGYTADNDGVRTLVADNISQGQIEGVSIERLQLVYYPDRNVNDNLYHGLAVRIKLGDTDITLMPARAYGIGATETTNIRSESQFVSSKTSYMTWVDAGARTAKIEVRDAAFAENMPALGTMTFSSSNPISESGIPLKVTLRPGGYTITADSIIPTIASTPYPKYKITELNTESDLFGNESSIEFKCMGVFQVRAEVTGCYTPQAVPTKK